MDTPDAPRATTYPLACLALACLAACGSGADSGRGTPADSAHLYADRLQESLGGESAWERTRFIAFHWLVERNGEVVSDRRHAWDRFDGRYRLEYAVADTPYVILFDEKTLREEPGLGKVPEGRAWKDGVELAGAALDTALNRAYGAFINDTYWLLMPFKWEDPGVHLAYEGTRTLSDSLAHPVVHLTFDQGLGVTEDQYWAFLDPDTGRMAAWQYHLGRDEAPGPVFWWEDWTPVGDLVIPLRRRTEDGALVIRFEDVRAGRSVPEGTFAPPAP